MGDELREKVASLMPRAKEDLGRLVAIPSIADARQMPVERVLEAAEVAVELFADAGLQDVRRLDEPDGYDSVYGEAPGPEGAPTVLLYCHYDVQPPLGDDEWEHAGLRARRARQRPLVRPRRGGRQGRPDHAPDRAAGAPGAASGHRQAARRGLGGAGLGAIEHVVADNLDLLRADAILIGDGGNFAVGLPTLETTLRGIANVTVQVRTLESPMHSGMFGGAAPDALVALIQILATLHDEHGNTRIDGLANDGHWTGVDYPTDQFRPTRTCSTAST